MIRIDNVANTFFKTQKKLSPKKGGKKFWQKMISCGSISEGNTTRLLMYLVENRYLLQYINLKIISLIESSCVMQINNYILSGWVKCKMA